MISRKSTTLVSILYVNLFIDYDEYDESFVSKRLYDFFYDRNYNKWFLESIKQIELADKEKLKDFIQGLLFAGFLVKKNHPQFVDDGIQQSILNLDFYGQKYLKKLAEDILRAIFTESLAEKIELLDIEENMKLLIGQVKMLLSQLELDGYIFKNGKLLPIENSVINQQTEQTYLEVLIDSLLLSDSKTIKHHLNLSEEYYSTCKWGDCISNSRMALEAILQQVADAVHVKKNGTNLSQNIYTRPVEVRKYLENENFFDTKETKTISEVYGLLSNTGSHPNISEKDQARLMRNLALSLSQYALITYEGFLKNNP
jgi:hypothetical protein